MSKTYYDILGIAETAAPEDIKKSFRKLSLLHHPDRNTGNPEYDPSRFKEINEAYETLSDPEKRKMYDMRNMHGGMHPGGGGGAPPFPEELFSAFFGGQGFPRAFFGGVPGQGMPNVRMFHNGIPVHFMNQLEKPVPIMKNISVSIEQAFTGCSMPLEIERFVIENGIKRLEKIVIYVDIPAGIDSNEVLLSRDNGNIIENKAFGDVKIFVEVINPGPFQRKGLDLIYTKEITLKEALCGFSFEMKYITGKVYSINNSMGSIIKPGYVKEIQNMGMTRDGRTGKLIIQFSILFPDSLTNEQMVQLGKLL